MRGESRAVKRIVRAGVTFAPVATAVGGDVQPGFVAARRNGSAGRGSHAASRGGGLKGGRSGSEVPGKGVTVGRSVVVGGRSAIKDPGSGIEDRGSGIKDTGSALVVGRSAFVFARNRTKYARNLTVLGVFRRLPSKPPKFGATEDNQIPAPLAAADDFALLGNERPTADGGQRGQGSDPPMLEGFRRAWVVGDFPSGSLWHFDTRLAADAAGEVALDFLMSRDGFAHAGGRVGEYGMTGSFPKPLATAGFPNAAPIRAASRHRELRLHRAGVITKSFLFVDFEDQLHRRRQVAQALGLGFALTIGARHFEASRPESAPRRVLHDAEWP